MKRMAGEQLIPYKSPIFEAGLEQYKFNLTQILRIFDRKEIPVFISNVVSNEKDQRPLVSTLLERTDSADFFLVFRQMETAFEAHKWDEVEKLGRHVKEQDSTYAKTYFVLGQTALKRGEPGKARHHFIKARQYDYLRFRAPVEINQIIMDLSQSTNASFVDVMGAFESESREGILGEELILEHLHPNLRGYAIIAEAFYKAILKKNLVSSPIRQGLTPDVWHEYPLTEVDTLFGNYEIQVLKERWPFYEKLEIDTLNRTFPEALAGGLVVKQLTWDQAMDKLYSFYHQKKDFKNTLRVAEAVIMEHPEHAAFYAKAGSVCLRLRYFDKGADHFQKAYDLQPSPEYARFAALCLLHQNKPDVSLKLLTKAIKDNQTDPKTMRLMDSLRKIMEMENQLKGEKANSQLLNQLAGHYFMIGLEDKARNLIGEALALEPSNITSLRFLRQMDRKQN